jgi:parallel beta-helix repeat protein/predicted outer membrane repeat protein
VPTINNTRFQRNQASSNGGAVYQEAGLLQLDGNRLYQNSALLGAAVYLTSGTANDVRISTTLSTATPPLTAGPVSTTRPAAAVFCTTHLLHNTAVGGAGGGIFSQSGNPAIRNNIFDRNNGTGVHIIAGDPTVSHNNAYDNDPELCRRCPRRRCPQSSYPVIR